jgi:hypothetical protein
LISARIARSSSRTRDGGTPCAAAAEAAAVARRAEASDVDARAAAAAGWSSKASEAELKGVEGEDRKRGTLGGEMRRAKSLRIGVHHADADVWGPV